jgi:hypothetical protein
MHKSSGLQGSPSSTFSPIGFFWALLASINFNIVSYRSNPEFYANVFGMISNA